jgi:signal transduction histidine kinase
VRKGLTRRTLVASAVLALLVGAPFVVLLLAIDEQRNAGNRAAHSQQVLEAASTLERLVLDLETGQRGFLITGQERFLQPWSAARDRLPSAAAGLVRLAAGSPSQERRAREIAAEAQSYVRDYSVPLVNAARKGSRGAAALADGKRRVDALRAQFDRFVTAERDLFMTQQRRANDDTSRAVMVATVGLAGSALLIALFAAYMTRAIVLPVRRAAAMAARLAGGDLGVRMPEDGVGEIGTLEQSFNTMGSSLEASRDELRMLAEEQAALRRVATLVARAVPAPQLFDAVAAEVRGVLNADSTQLVVGTSDVEEGSVAAIVLRTGRPARVRNARGTQVGAPIVVEGRLWGAMVARFDRADGLVPDTEERIAQFTELVATAIANANSREELAASRARVVATADETRRRLERDLHDGAQQSLTHAVITLKLARRALGDRDGAIAELVDEALDHAERATNELRDLAHGILPAVLSRGGLRAGVETLASRIRLPVRINVTPARFAPALEATAYFIIAEGLTNVVKHAKASRAEVRAFVVGGALFLEVRDDGVGGASIEGSSGLLGLHDRAAALNGELRVESAPGAGTVITATLPI